jgi:L-serine dehydratase
MPPTGAVILGLAGFQPESYDRDRAEAAGLADIRKDARVTPDGLDPLAFDPARDLAFEYGPPLPGHANGLVLMATDAQGDVILQETYYSVGGGFVLTAAELAEGRDTDDGPPVPFPFRSAAEMLEMCAREGKSIAELKRANELSRRPAAELDRGMARIWEVMKDCMDRGLATPGTLPGGLGVKRRAHDIHASLKAEHGLNLTAPHTINDWMSVYAMAVNEENAAGGRIVTAPTNGAAGVVPAVMKYMVRFHELTNPEDIRNFLLASAAIGGIIKNNASISGAEVGCQGEVGSAAAMAAAGLAEVLGGTPEQVENAAEIALEHHLGMTCDPVAGLVQVPCIERNALAAVKAVTAASLALKGRWHPFRAAGCLRGNDAPDRSRHEREIQGNQPGRPRGQRARVLRALAMAAAPCPRAGTSAPAPPRLRSAHWPPSAPPRVGRSRNGGCPWWQCASANRRALRTS